MQQEENWAPPRPAKQDSSSAPVYDEFGNYIGPDLSEEDDFADSEDEEYDLESEEEEEEKTPPTQKYTDRDIQIANLAAEQQQVVSFEDKKYYPDAEEVYGEAEVLVQEEDTQPISEPIIAPAKINNFDLVETHLPETTFTYQFVQGIMNHPELIRNVCIVGNLHHGKTLLTDMLVCQTHEFIKPTGHRLDAAGNVIVAGLTGLDRKTLRARGQEAHTRELRYSDNRADEQERGISIKASPVSLILPDSKTKSYLINIFDTPGHVNFLDEAVAALRLCDGALLVVDLLEGAMISTKKLIEAILRENLDIVLVLNSIDRLILELRLTPSDTFHKIRYVLKDVNECIADTAKMLGREPPGQLDPLLGNVVFGSAKYSFLFTLESFSQLYKNLRKDIPNPRRPDFDTHAFSQLLWGDIWQHPDTKKFQRTPPQVDNFDEEEDPQGPQRTFVQYILKPLYKLVAHAVAEEKPTLEPTLEELGIFLEPECYLLDTQTLLKVVCNEFFQNSAALVESIVKHVKNPRKNAPKKIDSTYTGNQTTTAAQSMHNCDPKGRLVVMTTKNYHRPDANTFDLFGRVMSGTIHKGEIVKVLGENYSLSDDEDMLVREVSHLWIYQGRYRVEVQSVPAGNWVLIGGVDPSIRKTATITSLARHPNYAGNPHAGEDDDDIEIFGKLRFPISAVIRVACEPLNPSELPKMLEGLRKIDKSYPLMKTKVEDSGEHVIIGTGELYLDCALHDLRVVYGDLEIRCSDPVVQICETVLDTSAFKAFAMTPNLKNRLSVIVEPLEKEIAEAIENEIIGPKTPAKLLASNLVENYGWDKLAARSVWAFSSDLGTNVLLNDVLPVPVSEPRTNPRRQAETIKDFVVHGFQWASREGPLIEEPLRNVKVKLIDCTLATEPMHRTGGQLIPTARRVIYSSVLLATPRLMEPMLFAEIVCPADCVPAILNVLAKRRGHLVKDLANPGTPLETICAYLPAIDSFGFETDIRTHTSGQAFVLTLFDRWEVLPGDPLDSSIVLKPLEPSPVPHLAREFLLKTRRRKGLTHDVSLKKYFDEAMLEDLTQKYPEIAASLK